MDIMRSVTRMHNICMRTREDHNISALLQYTLSQNGNQTGQPQRQIATAIYTTTYPSASPGSLDHVRALLRDHDRGRHRVRPDDLREDGRVAHPQPPHAMHPQLRIHDARTLPARLRTHPARRRVVVSRGDVLADERVDVRVAEAFWHCQVRERVALLPDVLRDAHGEAHARAHRHEVLWVREVPQVDGRRCARVARDEADGPARFWADEREEVAVRAAAGRDNPRAVTGDVHEFDVGAVGGVCSIVVARVVLRDREGVVEELRGEEGGDVLEGEREQARAPDHPPEELC